MYSNYLSRLYASRPLPLLCVLPIPRSVFIKFKCHDPFVHDLSPAKPVKQPVKPASQPCLTRDQKLVAWRSDGADGFSDGFSDGQF